MTENEENCYFNAKLQKALMKLISEEWYAYQLYAFSLLAVKADQAEILGDVFRETAEDELNDHMKELISWCRSYGYELPVGETEFRKYADKKISKQLSDLKKNKDAGYYIDEAIKSEEAAISSYKDVLSYKETSQFTDLQATLWHIYYDENEHLEKLNTLKIATDAGVGLVMD